MKKKTIKFELLPASALRSLATGSTVPSNEIKLFKNYLQNTEQVLLDPETFKSILEGEFDPKMVKKELEKLQKMAGIRKKALVKERVRAMAKAILGPHSKLALDK